MKVGSRFYTLANCRYLRRKPLANSSLDLSLPADVRAGKLHTKEQGFGVEEGRRRPRYASGRFFRKSAAAGREGIFQEFELPLQAC